jgi:hypothetical protein
VNRWLVGAVLGSGLLACFGSPPPTEPIDDTASWFDDPELRDPPDQPREPREPRKGRGDRDRKGDGDRRGKHGKRPEREPPPDTRPEPRPTPRPRREGIEPVGDDTWRVDRSKIDGWLADPDRIGASVVQRGSGYALTGVRSGSDAEALGAQNGDVVEKVNGNGLGTASELLTVLNLLKTADDLRVDLRRDGSAQVHHYEIVD